MDVYLSEDDSLRLQLEVVHCQWDFLVGDMVGILNEGISFGEGAVDVTELFKGEGNCFGEFPGDDSVSL